MNISVLIDAVVRQTVVLIAQLATAAGARADLASVADEVFVELTRELRTQGVSNKVIADMFGMLLRSYHKKVRRLSDGGAARRSTVWRAILDYVREQSPVSQTEVLARFRHDDEEIVRSVLRDLCSSDLLVRDGVGAAAHYTCNTSATTPHSERALGALAWVHIYHHGPLSREELADGLRVSTALLDPVVDELVADGRVVEDDEAALATATYVIPLHDPAGWEAAVFDHFQAVVTTISARLNRLRQPKAGKIDEGGSTYAFDLWEGHPLESEVLALYRTLRASTSDLRARVDAHNAAHPHAEEGTYRVIFYAGQHMVAEDEN